MNRISCVVGIAAVSALLAIAPSADATGVGAWGGQATSPNAPVYYGCINEDYGAAAFNFGSDDCISFGPYLWEVQLPVNQGTYTPSMGVAWPVGQPMKDYISCATVTESQTNTGSAYETTGYFYDNSTKGVGVITPGTVGVPYNGFMFASCSSESSAVSVP